MESAILRLHQSGPGLAPGTADHARHTSENPQSLSLGDLAEIVQYARRHHISVCPELESWGACGVNPLSLPRTLRSAGNVWGKSFAIGPKTFGLLEGIYDEVVPSLEEQSMVHLGLDEARWQVQAEAQCHVDSAAPGGTLAWGADESWPAAWKEIQLDRHLLSIYGGADAAWNPRQTEMPDAGDVHREYLIGRTHWRMLSWQTLFADTATDAILRDRGSAIFRGYYFSGPKAGQPVAPTVAAASKQDHCL